MPPNCTDRLECRQAHKRFCRVSFKFGIHKTVCSQFQGKVTKGCTNTTLSVVEPFGAQCIMHLYYQFKSMPFVISNGLKVFRLLDCFRIHYICNYVSAV